MIGLVLNLQALQLEHCVNKYLNINFQLRFKAGVQALPALQAELALQNTGKLSLDYLDMKMWLFCVVTVGRRLRQTRIGF
jgi:hypothetical protein